MFTKYVLLLLYRRLQIFVLCSQGKERIEQHKVDQLTRLATQSQSDEGVPSKAKPVQEPETKVKTAGETPVTPTQAIVGLPDEVRIIQKGIKVPAPKKEQDRARKLLKDHGGVLDLSWRAAVNGIKPKSIKFSGCETDPEAAKAAMLAQVEGD